MMYLEHEKLAAVRDHSQAIGEFLEWMDNQDITRCRWVKTDWGGEYMIDHRKIDGNILKLILRGWKRRYVTEVAC
jgi:hypothetical protein